MSAARNYFFGFCILTFLFSLYIKYNGNHSTQGIDVTELSDNLKMSPAGNASKNTVQHIRHQKQKQLLTHHKHNRKGQSVTFNSFYAVIPHTNGLSFFTFGSSSIRFYYKNSTFQFYYKEINPPPPRLV